MGRSDDVHVLVAIDDSPSARAVIATTLAFPWPERTHMHTVLATRTLATRGRPEYVRAAFLKAFERVMSRARRTLAQRWPDVSGSLPDRSPVEAIVTEAERLSAQAVVCGWRGRGALLRMLTGGSVSRGVVRHAPCSVLIVKRSPREVRRLVIGLDGSQNAERAVAFVAGLTRPPGGEVTLVRVVEPLRVQSIGLLPGAVRASLSREIAAENADQLARARRELARVARPLARAGWRVRMLVRVGVPLPELLRAARSVRAHVLVVGARGAGGMRGLLLGSVAEGTIERASLPVLVAR